MIHRAETIAAQIIGLEINPRLQKESMAVHGSVAADILARWLVRADPDKREALIEATLKAVHELLPLYDKAKELGIDDI